MIIIHKIDNFSSIFSLPRRKEDLSRLKCEISDYYTFGPYKPKVAIENDLVSIEIDTSSISSQKPDFDRLICGAVKRSSRRVQSG
jgi:hypothetical protein